MPEILAPVGGKEQLIAAVRSGADAVYLGAKNFNARRNADNFDGVELSEIVAYCHARNVQVHVTLNTLVMDSEMDELLNEIQTIAQSGADAVIVQDLAVAEIVRKTCPDLAMHASTQMTIHNLSGVQMAKQLGFKRVVLSRELSFEEIREIARNTDLELEVFVHGALCMCMSGMCYLSSMLGGRSGNRGLCAQPCRLDFRADEKDHALSLKDMSHIEHLRELAALGINSFKIEGRMKRPEYVAAAVTACKSALNGESPDLETLQAVFSRQGFTDGYFTGKRTADMFGFRSHDDVLAGEKVFKSLSNLYKNEMPKVPLTMELSISETDPSCLTVSDGKKEVTVFGNPCQKAEKSPTDISLAKRYLSKTGGTPFFLDQLRFSSDGDLVLPASEINEMRREALSELLKCRQQVIPGTFLPFSFAPTECHSVPLAPFLRVRAEKWELVSFLSDDITVLLPLREIEKHPEALSRWGNHLFAELPVLLFGAEESRLTERLSALQKQGLQHVVCENIGAIKIARDLALTIHGGHGLNILNSRSLAEYEQLGLSDATVSFELNAEKIKRLGGKLPRGILGYGHLPLMRVRSCPLKKISGCGNCPGVGRIKDRLGKEFPYLCFEKKFGTLLNSVPLWVADKEIAGIDFMTLYFTTETPERCREVYDRFLKKLPADVEKTNGLYYRELL